jgi:hypothetical protein
MTRRHTPDRHSHFLPFMVWETSRDVLIQRRLRRRRTLYLGVAILVLVIVLELIEAFRLRH